MFLLSILFSVYITNNSVLEEIVQTPEIHTAASVTAKRTFTRKRQRPRLRVTKVRPFPTTLGNNWDGHFSARNYSNTHSKKELGHIKRVLGVTMKNLPKDHVATLKNLEIKNKEHVSRGMANSKKLILHTRSIDSKGELMGVFIHELGHIVDLGKLKGSTGRKTKFIDNKKFILSDDPSAQFYKLSWNKTKKRKKGVKRSDFVSGYAMSDVFEDFAETYLFYRVHGEKFRKIMKDSKVLQAKYNFMKTVVFQGDEFQLNLSGESFIGGATWDTTLLSFELKDFLLRRS